MRTRTQISQIHVCVCAKSLQLCSTLCDPKDCTPPGSSVHGHSPGKNTGVGCHALLQGSSPPRNRTWVSCIQADSLPLRHGERSLLGTGERKSHLTSIQLGYQFQNLQSLTHWAFRCHPLLGRKKSSSPRPGHRNPGDLGWKRRVVVVLLFFKSNAKHTLVLWGLMIRVLKGCSVAQGRW